MQLQTSNWSKGDIDQSIKRLISYSCEILWSLSITSSAHNFVASQHFHPQLWCNILTMISMLHTLGFPSITLRFKSCMWQWSCCSMIFNLIHSTHYHDYCVKVQMCFKLCNMFILWLWWGINLLQMTYLVYNWHFLWQHVYWRIFAPFCALHGCAEKHTSLHVLPNKIKIDFFCFAFCMFCCCIIISNPPPV
jgi:hypothetical protein